MGPAPKPGAGPEGAPMGIGGAEPPWFARRPPGLCIVVDILDATGWWMGSEPALLWCGGPLAPRGV